MDHELKLAAPPGMITVTHVRVQHPGASLADLHQHVVAGQYVWLDICDATSQSGGAILLDQSSSFIGERIPARHDQIRHRRHTVDFTQPSRRLELLRDVRLKRRGVS